MQKKFILNLLFVLLLNVIVKPFYILGIDAEVLKQTGEDYGIYFSLLGLTFILNIFLDIGIVNFNTKNIAQHQHLLQKHFSGIITLRLLLSLVYFVLVFGVAWALDYPKEYYTLLAILAFNQVLVGFILYLRSNLAGLLLFKQDSILSVLDRFILIFILSYLLWFRTSTTAFAIEWFALAQTFAYSITLVIALFLVIKKTGRFKLGFNKLFSLAILRKSLPYATLILLMMIYYRSDAIMLERMLPNGKEETALYAQGYRFFEAFNMIGFLFAGLLLPLFSKLLKQKKDIAPLLFTSFKIIVAVSVILATATYNNKIDIIAWRYQISGNQLVHSASSFGVLMGCFVAVSSTYIFGTLLTANGSLKYLNRLALFGVGLNFLLNFLLIPNYGAYGASLASFITQLITLAGQVILVFVWMKVRIDYSAMRSIILFLIGISIAYFSFTTYVHTYWFYQFILFGGVGIMLAFITKMIDIKALVLMLKNRK